MGTAVNPSPAAVQGFCKTVAVPAGDNSLGIVVREESALGVSNEILGVGPWVQGDVCHSSNLGPGHGCGRLSLPVCVCVCVLNWVCLG